MREPDGGYALLWSLAIAGALALIGSVGLSLCALAMAHAHAGNAADLAALAAAADSSDPCATAERIANRNSAVLRECAPLGADVLLRVSVRSPQVARWLGGDEITASARAGRSALSALESWHDVPHVQ